MEPHLDSDIEIHRNVFGVDCGGICVVDLHDLVLRDVVFRSGSDLQNVIVRHDSFLS
jgi:hypothetical protein